MQENYTNFKRTHWVSKQKDATFKQARRFFRAHTHRQKCC